MYYSKEDIKNVPKITTLVTDFYILMGINLFCNNPYFYNLQSIQRLLEDVHRFQEMFNNKFKQMIEDYTYIVTYGEVRYLPYRAALKARENVYWFYALENNERVHFRPYYEGYIRSVYQYSKKSLAQFVQTCFDPDIFYWDEGYGGDRWYQIAKSLTLASTSASPTLFIDHALDLQHNNGLYLDKDVGIFDRHMGNVQDVLDYKRSATIFQLIRRYVALCDSVVLNIVDRFINITEGHLQTACNWCKERGIYTLEQYKWGVPFSEIHTSIQCAKESRDTLVDRNTSIYWVERYQPKQFGIQNATELLYIPPLNAIETAIQERDNTHLIYHRQWKTG